MTTPVGPVDALAGLAAPIDTLHYLPGNPRRGDVPAVAASLTRFGQRKPIVAKRDGTVIAGNHTLEAARSLGWSEIAVVYVDDDEATAQAFALADNRTAELGSYDNQALADLIVAVRDADEELLGATGWNDADLDDLLAKLQAAEPRSSLNDPDDVPDRAPAITVPGDVWLLGPHRVLCGDSTVPTDVEKLMAGALADMVWTDPPYGVSYVGKTADGLTIQNDGSEEFETILDGAFDSILTACRPGAAVYVAAPSGPRGVPFAVKLLDRSLFRQRLVWIKNSLVLGHSDYNYQHEDIYFGYTPGPGRQGRDGVGWYGDNAQTSVLHFNRPSRSEQHPTMKPVDLISYCIINSSRPGDLVLDLFGGSGSTLIAAHDQGRHAALAELDSTYVDVICRRYQEHTGVRPINASTGAEHDFTG